MDTRLRQSQSPFARLPIATEATPKEHLRNLLLIGTYAAQVKQLAEERDAPKKTLREISELGRKVDLHLATISAAIKAGTISAETLYEHPAFYKRAEELNSLFDTLAEFRDLLDAGARMQKAAKKMKARAEEAGGRFSGIAAEA